MTTQDLFIAALIALGFSRKASASTTAKKAGDALSRIAGLQARAHQPSARAWIPDLIAAGASPALAEMLSRWIGIESSGNPSKPSPAGEYGLLQILPTTAKEALTPGEWLQLKDPTTSRADQAKIALKQFAWHQDRAHKYISAWPGNTHGETVFYAKLHHARPKDLSDAKATLTGNARADAKALTAKWKNDPAALVRLAAANVITWGTVTP